jgi:hypothetical protein
VEDGGLSLANLNECFNVCSVDSSNFSEPPECAPWSSSAGLCNLSVMAAQSLPEANRSRATPIAKLDFLFVNLLICIYNLNNTTKNSNSQACFRHIKSRSLWGLIRACVKNDIDDVRAAWTTASRWRGLTWHHLTPRQMPGTLEKITIGPHKITSLKCNWIF